jgi:hypothetical protein
VLPRHPPSPLRWLSAQVRLGIDQGAGLCQTRPFWARGVPACSFRRLVPD